WGGVEETGAAVRGCRARRCRSLSAPMAAPGRKAARAINENLAAIVTKHPDRFVALANVPLQAPDLAAEELDYCVKRLGFRGVEIGTNVAGQEISRGRDAFWAKAQELDAMVFMHPNGFTGRERPAGPCFIHTHGKAPDSTRSIA